MEFLHMNRFEAAWYLPAVTLVRMQKAHNENHGADQNWGKSRLDKIAEMEYGQQSGTQGAGKP